MPVAIPDTIPDTEPMVATARLELVQIPPVTASETVDVTPKQTFSVPVILAGEGLIVTMVVVVHPPENE